MENDRFGKSIGIWKLTVGGADLELRPKVGDNRKFMSLMMDKKLKDDPVLRFDKFKEFLRAMILRDCGIPESEFERMDEYLEFNVMQLLDETMITFKWTTREELEKMKRESLGDIKKLIEKS